MPTTRAPTSISPRRSARRSTRSSPGWPAACGSSPRCGRPWSPGGRRYGLFDRHVVGANQLVAARLPGQAPVGAVEIDLLIERDRGYFLDPQLVDLLVLRVALLLVHLRLRFLDHPVEVLIEPVHEDPGRLEERHVD